MKMKQTARRPKQPGIYWFIRETGDAVIVQLIRDGSGWFLYMLGTDEMFYMTRPKDVSREQWKAERKWVGRWVGPLEPPR